MFTETHILKNHYNNHSLERTISGFDVSAVDCSADKSSGWKGTTITLTPKTVPWNQRFSGWSATGTTIENSAFTLTADVTAQANFETAKSLTLQNDGHGFLATTLNAGFINDTANLSPYPDQGYVFSGYTITGATLTGNKFTFTGSDVTAKAWFRDEIESVTIGTQTWMSKNLAVDDGGTGIYTRQVSANGVDFGTQYYYTTAAAARIASTIDGWHLPTESDWNTLIAAIGGSDNAGILLKSTTGWNSTGNGTDTYNFTVLPCGASNGSTAYSIGGGASFDISGNNNQVVGFSYNYDFVYWPVSTAAYYRSVRLVHD